MGAKMVDQMCQSEITFSIIIPVKTLNDYVDETISHIRSTNRSDLEVIILPNRLPLNHFQEHYIRIIETGRISPARKRDLGAMNARGKLLVFLDDDSYPNGDYFDVATKAFEDEVLVAVGGPAMTPPQNSFWQRVSGATFLSKVSGGFPERYLPIGSSKYVDDWPSVNFIIKRDAFISLGGFNSDFWPGEDTLFCLRLLKSGHQILYLPDLKVWHHRRGDVIEHLKQIGAYGKHRGFFARKFPATSRRPVYFIPSLFSFFVAVSPVAIITEGYYLNFIVLGWGIYLTALAKAAYDICKHEKLWVAINAIWLIVVMHFWYGVNFFSGMFRRNLKSKLR